MLVKTIEPITGKPTRLNDKIKCCRLLKLSADSKALCCKIILDSVPVLVNINSIIIINFLEVLKNKLFSLLKTSYRIFTLGLGSIISAGFSSTGLSLREKLHR